MLEIPDALTHLAAADQIRQRNRLFACMRVFQHDSDQAQAARMQTEQHVVAARDIAVIEFDRAWPCSQLTACRQFQLASACASSGTTEPRPYPETKGVRRADSRYMTGRRADIVRVDIDETQARRRQSMRKARRALPEYKPIGGPSSWSVKAKMTLCPPQGEAHRTSRSASAPQSKARARRRRRYPVPCRRFARLTRRASAAINTVSPQASEPLLDSEADLPLVINHRLNCKDALAPRSRFDHPGNELLWRGSDTADAGHVSRRADTAWLPPDLRPGSDGRSMCAVMSKSADCGFRADLDAPDCPSRVMRGSAESDKLSSAGDITR